MTPSPKPRRRRSQGLRSIAPGISVSADFSAIYLVSGARLTADAPPVAQEGSAGLYRFDIATDKLSYVAQLVHGSVGTPSPDGRYDYFEADSVLAIPGGSTENPYKESLEGLRQLYRYDSVENVVECVSCASSFDPEPKLGIRNSGGAIESTLPTLDGTPRSVYASADGEYAFFETPAALLPSDVNGEMPPEPFGSERYNGTPSNDIYEWRRDGVNGCGEPQGCISLITPGNDGWLVVLLGTTDSGHDVFIYTHSQLVGQDNDTAGDIYDARIGGGFAEPARPVECEGDACSTPFAPPSDLTPSSATFQGTGDVGLGLTAPKLKPKSKAKSKTKKKHKQKKTKRKATSKRKVRKSDAKSPANSRHGGAK